MTNKPLVVETCLLDILVQTEEGWARPMASIGSRAGLVVFVRCGFELNDQKNSTRKKENLK